jgi:hypothetical protein
MSAASGGFQVDRDAVSGSGQSAIQIGCDIIALADAVPRASDVAPEPAGLRAGGTLLNVVPLWQQHLRAVGADVERTGGKLCQASANYNEAEMSAMQAIRAIQV